VKRLVQRALAVAALCLAACTGSLFRSHATATAYMLSAGPASHAEPAPAAEIPVDLAVLKPKARPGLESDRIAVLYPDRRLDYFADARWSGPLGEVLQELAVQEFHSHANLRTVSGDASVFASAYWLEIEITDFQAEYTSAAAAPTVRVSLRARLGSSGDRRLLGQFAATAQKPAAENRLSSIVDAFESAADASLAEIAAQAAEKLARVSEAR
jgi:cholesterol transport system auxiliary component